MKHIKTFSIRIATAPLWALFQPNELRRFFVTFAFLLLGLVPFSTLHAQINYPTTKYCQNDPPTTFSSVGTWYTGLNSSPGTGNCGFPAGYYDPNMYAAIDGHTSNDYQNGLVCGACVAAHYNANSVTVMIVDNCGTCRSEEHTS